MSITYNILEWSNINIAMPLEKKIMIWKIIVINNSIKEWVYTSEIDLTMGIVNKLIKEIPEYLICVAKNFSSYFFWTIPN